MNNKERAKQFLPFDAMKGLTEALKIREEKRTRVEKRELDEEMKAEIGRSLARLCRGCEVRLTFFSRGLYLTVDGTVTDLDAVYGYLKLGEERIYFDDIYSVKLL